MLAVLAAIVLGSWVTCGAVYATNGGGGYNGGVFATLIFVAVAFTLGAAIALVGAWRAELRVIVPAVVSLLAAVSILVLAVAINSRG